MATPQFLGVTGAATGSKHLLGAGGEVPTPCARCLGSTRSRWSFDATPGNRYGFAVALLGDRSFFEGKSLQELAQSQGVGPVKDIAVFTGGFPEGEDLDELLEEIYRLREP